MFQTFDVKTDKSWAREHLPPLRIELAKQNLDGFYIPHADEYQNEYLPACGERLAWVTGFSGSAGTAIVLRDKAAIFVDGRYTVQVREQVDETLLEIKHITTEPPLDWLAKNLAQDSLFGYDPWLHTISQVEALQKACAKVNATLVPCKINPIDTCWDNQPEQPITLVVPHAIDYAGSTSEEKRLKIGKILKHRGSEAVVLSKPESIAWLLNIRGQDVTHTPLPLSRAIAFSDGSVQFFVNPEKLTEDLKRHFGNAIAVQPEDKFGEALIALGHDKKTTELDPENSPAWVLDRLNEGEAAIEFKSDPCVLPRACKNKVEQEGARQAHLRDGAAITRFLAWISVEGPNETLDEISAAKKLESFRTETNELKDLSFQTISAAGPNAALPHYSVTTKSNLPIKNNSIYLVDSGGQYCDGTTDITRTIAIGTPTKEMRDRFTYVLKGHIAIATARFPEGTAGGQLDVLARIALWKAGLNFDHGTGHGVGSYLGVHEGPQAIAPGPRGIAAALREGMIISNEPGYYKEGEYGIRIENLVIVTAPVDIGGDRPMHRFETITLAPIDLNLVEVSLLLDEEKRWLNAYHKNVQAKLSPLVDEQTRQWLAQATKEI